MLVCYETLFRISKHFQYKNSRKFLPSAPSTFLKYQFCINSVCGWKSRVGNVDTKYFIKLTFMKNCDSGRARRAGTEGQLLIVNHNCLLLLLLSRNTLYLGSEINVILEPSLSLLFFTCFMASLKI